MDVILSTCCRFRLSKVLFLVLALISFEGDKLALAQGEEGISSGIVETPSEPDSDAAAAATDGKTLKSKLVRIPFIKMKKTEAEELPAEENAEPAQQAERQSAPLANAAAGTVEKPVKKAAQTARSVTSEVKKEAAEAVSTDVAAVEDSGAASAVDSVEKNTRKPGIFNLFRKNKETAADVEADSQLSTAVANDASASGGEIASAASSAIPTDGSTVIVPPSSQLAAQEQKRKWSGFRFGKKESEEEFPVALEDAYVDPADLQLSGDGVEVIYEDGRFVSPRKMPVVQNDAAEANSRPREKPVMINGVKTYKSWGDINARRPSVSERLLRRR